jgi:hypothetical protein
MTNDEGLSVALQLTGKFIDDIGIDTFGRKSPTG